jgi:hypothetical protein
MLWGVALFGSIYLLFGGIICTTPATAATTASSSPSWTGCSERASRPMRPRQLRAYRDSTAARSAKMTQ